MKLSKIYEDFHNEINISVPYMSVDENKTRLDLSTAFIERAGEIKTDYNNKYTLYIDPATHSDQNIKNMKMAYDEYLPFFQKTKVMLKNDLMVTLLGEDYANIFIHKDAEPRTRVPAPKYAPICNVKEQSHLKVRIITTNSDPDDTGEVKLPVDVEKLGRKLSFTAIDEGAPAMDTYKTIEIIGAADYTLSFDEDKIGKKVWLISWYINPTGEVGPNSYPISFIVI